VLLHWFTEQANQPPTPRSRQNAEIDIPDVAYAAINAAHRSADHRIRRRNAGFSRSSCIIATA